MRFVHSWWMSGELLRGHTHDSQRMTFAIMGTIINSTVAIWAPTKLKALMHQTQSRPSELLESSTGDTMIQCIKLMTRTQERLWQLHKRDTGKMKWAFRGGSNNIACCEYVDKPRDVYKAYLQRYLHKLWVFLDSNSNGTGSFRQNKPCLYTHFSGPVSLVEKTSMANLPNVISENMAPSPDPYSAKINK